MPWLIAIAELKEAARVALAAKRALEKDLRHLDTLVERLDKEHGVESYFPLTRKCVKTIAVVLKRASEIIWAHTFSSNSSAAVR